MAYRNYSVANGFTIAKDGTGDFTTFTTACAAAVAGTIIFAKSGTYTENFTLPAGVTLVAYSSEGDAGDVIIQGTITMTAAGTSSISGMQLLTNSTTFLTISGSNAVNLYLVNCYFNCANNTGISWTNSNASSNLFVYDSTGTSGAATANLFTATGSGLLRFDNLEQFYGSNVTTASTTSGPQVLAKFCTFNFPLSTSSTGSIGLNYVNIQCQNQNTTPLTLAGSSTGTAEFCTFSAGTASAVSVGSGTTLTLSNSDVASTNASTLAGAGTIIINNVNYIGVGNLANNAVTTITQAVSTALQRMVVQTFTSGTPTYTPTLGMKYCTVEVVGGGGGGGGSGTPTTTNGSAGGGGGGGGYARKTLTAATVGASQTVTVGGGGAGGANPSGTGTTGTTSSFGVLVTATGGLGGNGSTGTVGPQVSAGGVGGTGTGGDFNITGNSGTMGFVLPATPAVVYSGNGGGSCFCGGADGSSTGTPSNGTNYGGGGGGAASTTSGGAAKAGGNGSAGIVVVTDYI